MKESHLLATLRLNWDKLFPDFTLKGTEYRIPGHRLDFAAVAKDSDLHVVGEVKTSRTQRSKALGQLQVYRQAYSQHMGVPLEKVEPWLVILEPITEQEEALAGLMGIRLIVIALPRYVPVAASIEAELVRLLNGLPKGKWYTPKKLAKLLPPEYREVSGHMLGPILQKFGYSYRRGGDGSRYFIV